MKYKHIDDNVQNVNWEADVEKMLAGRWFQSNIELFDL